MDLEHLRGKSREEIEAWWAEYYQTHPKPSFIEVATIAKPYGYYPSDWYEAHEIEAFLDAGFEWDSHDCMWRHYEDDAIDEDDYDEDSEP